MLEGHNEMLAVKCIRKSTVVDKNMQRQVLRCVSATPCNSSFVLQLVHQLALVTCDSVLPKSYTF